MVANCLCYSLVVTTKANTSFTPTLLPSRLLSNAHERFATSTVHHPTFRITTLSARSIYATTTVAGTLSSRRTALITGFPSHTPLHTTRTYQHYRLPPQLFFYWGIFRADQWYWLRRLLLCLTFLCQERGIRYNHHILHCVRFHVIIITTFYFTLSIESTNDQSTPHCV